MGEASRVPSLVQPGERISHYEILDELGRGGMGIVYRARDLTLGRRVALKCALASGTPETDSRHLKRLLREARAVSRLSHPHIVPVFEVVEHEGVPWMAMALVEGASLRGHLSSGPLPTTETLRYAEGLASALEAAHGRNILHRDINPNNVMVTNDGHAMLMDFGLARWLHASDASSTHSHDSELDGRDRVVGTLRYMSPEQVLGKPLDARSDLFSLGAVLYEMCTGEPAFPGEGPQVLDALLHRQPLAISRLNYEAPAELERIVRKCLVKSPDERYQSARDLLVDVRSVRRFVEHQEYSGMLPAALPGESEPPHAREKTAPAGRRRFPAFGVMSGLAAAAVATGALSLWAMRATRTVPLSPIVLSIEPPAGTQFSEGSRNTPAISPDGQYVALVATALTGELAGKTQLWLRPLRSTEAQLVAGSQGARGAFWSPDSRSVAFFTNTGLTSVTLTGVRSETVVATTEQRGGTWGTSGIMLVALDPQSGLFQIPATGGQFREVRQVMKPDPSRGELGYMWPYFLRDGRRFIYFVLSNDEQVRGIYLGSLDGSAGRRLVASDGSGVVANGRLLFVRDGALVSQPFDEAEGRLDGQPARVLEGVDSNTSYRSAVSASEVNSLVYSSNQVTDLTQLAWYDRQGRLTQAVDVTAKRRNPALSPDGRYLAIEQYRDSLSELRIFDLVRGSTTRLTNAVEVKFPVWSPDGRLAYASSDHGALDIYARSVEGTGKPVLLLDSPSVKMPTDWSEDGRFLAYADLPPGGSYDLWVLPLEKGAQPIKIPHPSGQAHSGKFSPDVKWLAYVSTESIDPEVYVRRFPEGGEAHRVSVSRGYDPEWTSSRTLSFLDGQGQLMEVEIPMNENGVIGQPRPIFQTKVITPGTSRNHYAWSADGKHVLLNSPATDGGVNVVLQWSALPTR